MTPNQALLQLPAKPVTLIIDKLVAIRQQSKDDPEIPVPLVTLHLRNGRTESGWIVTRATDPVHGDCFLLHVPGANPSQPSADALYVMTAAIDAITVHDTGAIVHLLSFGAIANPLNAGDVSRMDVKRKAHELATALTTDIGSAIAFEVDFDGMLEAPEALRAMLDCIKQTSTVLHTFSEDAIGKDAIRKAIRKVAFAQGGKAVKLKSDTLHVTADFAQGNEGLMAKEDLRKAISGVL